MSSAKKIVFVHLLNDLSGSPRILSQVIQGLLACGISADIHTSQTTRPGFLSQIDGASTYSFFYRWSSVKLITLFYFFLSQTVLFFKLLRYWNKDIVIYVNTLLPFGASLAGKVMNKPVIYHIHETSIQPELFKKFLLFIAQNCGSEAIYVSKFLLEKEKLEGIPCQVIYNALSPDFLSKALAHQPYKNGVFNILMLSSLKTYKGINQFVTLAKEIRALKFQLVVNATQAEIDHHFQSEQLPENLTLYPSQTDVHPFYEKAHLVLNLSHPEQWVETFGMTALEAMTYGIPVIVPPVGGIAELTETNESGYRIDVRNMEELKRTIIELATNPGEWEKRSHGARLRAKDFHPITMISAIEKVVAAY